LSPGIEQRLAGDGELSDADPISNNGIEHKIEASQTASAESSVEKSLPRGRTLRHILHQTQFDAFRQIFYEAVVLFDIESTHLWHFTSRIPFFHQTQYFRVSIVGK